MSFEGVGLVVALLIYGAVKMTQFAAESIGRMHRKSAAKKAAAARAAHAEAERIRRDEAERELRAMDTDLARSAGAFMKEMQEAEKRMEAERLETVHKLDAEWDASIREVESKADKAPEALTALHDFHKKRTAELTASMAKATETMELKLKAECNAMCLRTTEKLNTAAAEMTHKIDEASATVEERNARYESYARKTLAEAESMLAWIRAHYDLDKLAAPELIETETLLEGVRSALAGGSVAAAAGNAGLAAGSVQNLHMQAERRTAAFARGKCRVAEAVAEMMDQVEASRELLHPGDPEELQELVTEETDADFWSEGRLKKLWERAQELQAQAEAFDVKDDAAIMTLHINEVQRALMSEYTRTRMMLLSRHDVLELAKKVIASHEENDWEMSRDPEYAAGDARRSLRLYFTKDGDERMVTIKSRYNPHTGLYEQQLVRHVEESGIPDEAKRRADDEAINRSLTEMGMPSSMKVTCKGETIGMHQSLSDVIDDPSDRPEPVRRSAT